MSVIVPIFNSEAYLDECIQSILSSTLKELEIILVNDGSTDSSGGICDAYAAKESRIKVVHQANMGISGARNTGIKIAVGAYISFVDSDDFIDNQMLYRMHQCAINKQVDIVGSGFIKCDEKGKPIKHETHPFQTYGRMDEASTFKMLHEVHQTNVLWFVWRNLYSRKLLTENGICFNADLRFAEDSIFNLYALKAAKGFCAIDHCGYHYRDTPSSLTSKKGKTYLVKSLETQFELKKQFYEAFDFDESAKMDLYRYTASHQLPMVLHNERILHGMLSKKHVANILKMSMFSMSINHCNFRTVLPLTRGIAIIFLLSKLKLKGMLALLLNKIK